MEAIRAKNDDFKETKAKLGAKMEDGHIRPIIDWSLTFGEYAAKIQQIEAAEHELEAISDRFDEVTLRKDRVKEASTFIESAELIAIYK